MRMIASLAVARHGLPLIFLLAFAGVAPAQEPRGSGWIVIPAAQYSELRGRAFPVPAPPRGSGVEATLSRVDYNLRVEGDLASGQAVVTIDVLRDGWVRVPIPPGLLVREARLAGKLVSLVRNGREVTALLTGRGRSVLQFDVALPVASAGGEERLVLPPGASGVTRASLTLGRPDVEVRIGGGLAADQPEDEGSGRWVAFANGSDPLTFTWRRKMEEQKRAPLAPRLRGSLAEVLALGEDNTQISAEVALEIVQGAAHDTRILTPPGVTVNAVDGANIADWRMNGADLTITFLEPVDQKTAFTISAEARLPREGSIDLPLLRLAGAERESGGVAVEVLGAGEIRNLRSKGLERVDPAELGASVAARQSPSLLAFRVRATGGERSLGVDVARYTQQAVLTANVEEARYRALIAPDGKTLVEARYAVRNNQRNFARVTLPPGATLWSASVGGLPVRPGRGPDGGLLLPLAKSRAGEDAPLFAVEVLFLVPGSAWSDKGRATLALPALDLPVSRTGITLYYPPQHRVTAEPGAFRVQEFAEPASPAFTGGAGTSSLSAPPLPASPAQQLIDRYRARRDALHSGPASPLPVTFPAVGPSLYLAAELTAENQTPNIELNFRPAADR